MTVLMLQPHECAAALMDVELTSPGYTKRSLGVLYALCLASIPHDDEAAWKRINEKVRDRRDVRFLDEVKKIGWSTYQTVCAGDWRQREAALSEVER